VEKIIFVSQPAEGLALKKSRSDRWLPTAEEIYARPATKFVADFIGTMNFVSGVIERILPEKGGVVVRTEFNAELRCGGHTAEPFQTGQQVFASIRPEDVQIVTDAHPSPAENFFKGTIAHKAYLGNFLYFFVQVNGAEIRVQVPHYLPQEEGQEISLFLNPEKCIVLR